MPDEKTQLDEVKEKLVGACMCYGDKDDKNDCANTRNSREYAQGSAEPAKVDDGSAGEDYVAVELQATETAGNLPWFSGSESTSMETAGTLPWFSGSENTSEDARKKFNFFA